MLVLLDGLFEFVNFLLEQHFKQVGHLHLLDTVRDVVRCASRAARSIWTM